MKPLTIRLDEDTKESLEDEADEYDRSVSEHVRVLIEHGREYDDVKQDRDRLQNQLQKLIDEREETTEIVEYVEEERSYRQVGIVTRAKWWLWGMPDDVDDGRRANG